MMNIKKNYEKGINDNQSLYLIAYNIKNYFIKYK